MSDNKKNKNPTDKDAEQIIGRVEIDSESIGTSSLARSADKARNHFMAKGADPDDPIEVWGTRIGRFLSVIIAAGLIIYLYNTYLT